MGIGSQHFQKACIRKTYLGSGSEAQRKRRETSNYVDRQPPPLKVSNTKELTFPKEPGPNKLGTWKQRVSKKG